MVLLGIIAESFGIPALAKVLSLSSEFPIEYRKMNILITGGAGFIGSHLAEQLLSKNHHVTIIDDLSTGSIQNIQHLKGADRFHYFLDSLTNLQLMAELVDSADVIYHLAAAV